MVECDIYALGDIAADVQNRAALRVDAADGYEQMASAADGVTNLAVDIADFAALFQHIGIVEFRRQNEADTTMLVDVGRRMTKNKVGIR